jgi:hypothetical protein
VSKRLLHILGESWAQPELAERLDEYQRILFREIALIDLLVDGCYRSLHAFLRRSQPGRCCISPPPPPTNTAASEAASGSSGSGGGSGGSSGSGSGYDSRLWFLNADNPEFTATVAALHQQIDDGCKDKPRGNGPWPPLCDLITRVGLFDPSAQQSATAIRSRRNETASRYAKRWSSNVGLTSTGESTSGRGRSCNGEMNTGDSSIVAAGKPCEPRTISAWSGMTSSNARKPSLRFSSVLAIFTFGNAIAGSMNSSAGS